MADGAATAANSAGAQVLARFGRGYAALVGLVALVILVQGIFAGVFVEPGSHIGALNAHDVNADVALGSRSSPSTPSSSCAKPRARS